MIEGHEVFDSDNDGSGKGKWKPTRGVVVNLELEKRLLNSLGDIAEADGVNSVYQMIRNALYAYVKHRTSKTRRFCGKVKRYDATYSDESKGSVSDFE